MRTLLTVLLAAGALLAQNADETKSEVAFQGAVTVAPFGNGFNWQTASPFTVDYVHDLNFGPIVKNAPYAAESVTETIQQLSDGNRIVQRQTSKLYRDIQGRERREESAPMAAIFISDPISGESYTLHPDTMTAEKGPFRAVGNFTVKTAQPTVIHTSTNNDGKNFFFVSAGQVLISRNAEQLPKPREESLGTQIIEGVEAEGTRTTITIPAGSIGNERDINIIDERWFSPDLQMTVMTRHADPRSGKTTYKLTNLQRTEQVRSLFEVPTSYTLNEGRAQTIKLKERGTVRIR